MMNFTKSLSIAATGLALIAAATTASIAPAQARGGGRQIFEQDYHFSKPMHGYSGHAGNYYCDYQRLPERKCDANGQNCRIVGWTLRELCQ